MMTKIPREVLWEDKKTMDEMLEKPLFNVLHEAFIYFDKEPMLFPMNELEILNEVGYQVTWLCYHSRFGLEPDIDQFTREVFAHTGLIDHAMTVVSLVQAVVTLVNFPPLNLSNRTKRELQKLNKESWCRRYVDSFVKRVLKDGYFFDNQFLPNKMDYQIPVDMEEKPTVSMCAEPSFEEHPEAKCRSFTLDEIIIYAQENLSIDKSVHIQNMLFNLLVEDGTREELKKVASITASIKNRDKSTSTHNEIVLHKHVNTEIQKVEAEGIGVNNEIKKD